jgi:hypothetical protein
MLRSAALAIRRSRFTRVARGKFGVTHVGTSTIDRR